MPVLTSEKELEEYLFQPQDDGSFYCPVTDEYFAFGYRQYNLNPYGVIDLLYAQINEFGNAVDFYIYEIKKDRLDISSIKQIARYRQGIIHYTKEIERLHRKKRNIRVNVYGLLIGDNLDGDDETVYLVDSIPWLNWYTYDLSLKGGVSFNESSNINYDSPVDIRWTRNEPLKMENHTNTTKEIMIACLKQERAYNKWERESQRNRDQQPKLQVVDA